MTSDIVGKSSGRRSPLWRCRVDPLTWARDMRRRFGQELSDLRWSVLEKAGKDLDEAFFRAGIRHAEKSHAEIARFLNLSTGAFSALLSNQSNKAQCDRLTNYILDYRPPFTRPDPSDRFAIADIAVMNRLRVLTGATDQERLGRRNYEIIRWLALAGALEEGSAPDASDWTPYLPEIRDRVGAVFTPFSASTVERFCVRKKDWHGWPPNRFGVIREFSQPVNWYVAHAARQAGSADTLMRAPWADVSSEEVREVYHELGAQYLVALSLAQHRNKRDDQHVH